MLGQPRCSLARRRTRVVLHMAAACGQRGAGRCRSPLLGVFALAGVFLAVRWQCGAVGMGCVGVSQAWCKRARQCAWVSWAAPGQASWRVRQGGSPPAQPQRAAARPTQRQPAPRTRLGSLGGRLLRRRLLGRRLLDLGGAGRRLGSGGGGRSLGHGRRLRRRLLRRRLQGGWVRGAGGGKGKPCRMAGYACRRACIDCWAAAVARLRIAGRAGLQAACPQAWHNNSRRRARRGSGRRH